MAELLIAKGAYVNPNVQVGLGATGPWRGVLTACSISPLRLYPCSPLPFISLTVELAQLHAAALGMREGDDYYSSAVNIQWSGYECKDRGKT